MILYVSKFSTMNMLRIRKNDTVEFYNIKLYIYCFKMAVILFFIFIIA